MISVDQDDFSPSELWALDEAWKCVMSKAWNESQDFFHKGSFVGVAYLKAREDGSPIDWRDIIDAYKKEHPTYTIAEEIKAVISV